MPLIEKLKTAGGEKYYELKSIYTSIGTCQLRQNREAEAEESFRKASEYTLKLISTDHTNHIDLYNGVATYSNIVAAYFAADKKLEAEPWVDLQDSLFNLYKDSSGAFPEDVDNLHADVLFNRALIADAKGEKDKADFLRMVPNAPIGLWPDLEYKGETIETIKGRPLFIYTDGLTEAENLRQKQFGDDHLLDIMRQTHFDISQQLIDALAVEVGKHRNGAEPNDDLTMMCIRVV